MTYEVRTTRSHRRSLAVGATVALAALGLMVAPSAAAGDKVDVCHKTGNGSFHLINISANAVRKHLTQHGDGVPGGEVPGMSGFRFDADCGLVSAPIRFRVGGTMITSSGNRQSGQSPGGDGSIVLQNNGGDDLVPTSYGPFIFPTPLDDGSTFDVSILSASQICVVS